MDLKNKELFRKYVLGELSAEEREELLHFLRNSKDSDVNSLPEGEDLLNLVPRKQLNSEAAERMYKNIMAFSPMKSRHRRLRKIRRNFLAAAVVTGLICGGLLFQRQLQLGDELRTGPDSGVVTLELENGQKQFLNELDSLEITDSQGRLIGYQKGSNIVYLAQKEQTDLIFNTIEVPYGKRIELSLSDGTRVYLNAGTSFKFPVAFVEGRERKVFLTGEAFFDVTHDKAHPFVVNTDKLDVEVLGTMFNVEAYPNAEMEEVVLLEGEVRVSNSAGKNFLLNPDQKVSYNGISLEKTEVNAADLTSWRNGYLTLNATSTAHTIALLERYYNIDIHSREQQDPDKVVGSGKIYLSEEVENVMNTLSILTNNYYSYKPASDF